MYLFVLAACGVLANPFFFISHNPFQALSITSTFCGVLLILEAVLLSWKSFSNRLSLIRALAGGIGVLSFVIAIISGSWHVACVGATSLDSNVNAVLTKQAVESETALMTLQLIVTGLCAITILLLLIGIFRKLQVSYQN